MTKWIQAYMVEELNPHDDCAGTGRVWDFNEALFVSPSTYGMIRPDTTDKAEAEAIAAENGGRVIPLPVPGLPS